MILQIYKSSSTSDVSSVQRYSVCQINSSPLDCCVIPPAVTALRTALMRLFTCPVFLTTRKNEKKLTDYRVNRRDVSSRTSPWPRGLGSLALALVSNILAAALSMKSLITALVNCQLNGNRISIKLTRSPAVAEGPREHTVSRNLVQYCTNVRRIAL